MADPFERLLERKDQLEAINASLLSTIKELMEALEGMVCDHAPRGEDYLKANAALCRAKSLMEQKP